MKDTSSWIVLKFGGTSVSSKESWDTIARQIERVLAEGARPLVVCSALSGISDSLERVIEKAPKGEHHHEVDGIIARHIELSSSLDLDGTAILAEDIEQLVRLSQGAALVEEISPSLKARILATGEMMSTRLGAEYLASLGLDIGWCDAREFMVAQTPEHGTLEKRFLSAVCPFDDDPGLREQLAAYSKAGLLTQGFIASDENGRTVILGRGGSDASAGYLAARLGAIRLEIWTDVPGMFTANPLRVPHARLLKSLDYEEAQELATMGAKVLHPRCIPPARARSIPIHIHCTPHPTMPGTVIASRSPDERARVKAVSAKTGVTVVSMDTLGMWQQVGFLADVFEVFKHLGLSIDLVATSESNVTVTLDPKANLLSAEIKDVLMTRLDEVCTARLTDGCAVVSLVGRNIRSILSGLTSALEVFEEHHVHLVSQAASDLNLSLVVDEDQADRLIQNLHALLLGEEGQDIVLGPRWTTLAPDQDVDLGVGPSWWRLMREELCRIGEEHGPVFVYEPRIIERQADLLLNMKAIDRVFFAMKANSHEGILRQLTSKGLGLECVSVGEMEWAKRIIGENGNDLLFTPNFAPRSEYEKGFSSGALITLDNLHPLEHWPEVFEGRDILIRIDPGKGRGHHSYVRTAGPRSKFGVSPEELPRLSVLAGDVGARVVGLHAHVGSGVHYNRTWADVAVYLETFRYLFPKARVLNLGGGLAVPERPGQGQLDLDELDESLGRFKTAQPDVELWLEPGRFLVSEAGVLLARVTQVKSKGRVNYVGLDTGMNSLIRPALYGAHHGIVNLTRLDETPVDFFEVVGPICESGDVLGHSRRLPRTEEGDVMLIANCGAYGRVMSCDYNMRSPAGELVLGYSKTLKGDCQ